MNHKDIIKKMSNAYQDCLCNADGTTDKAWEAAFNAALDALLDKLPDRNHISRIASTVTDGELCQQLLNMRKKMKEISSLLELHSDAARALSEHLNKNVLDWDADTYKASKETILDACDMYNLRCQIHDKYNMSLNEFLLMAETSISSK